MNIEESAFQFLDSIPKIRVVIRKRPLTKRELAKSEQDIIDVRGTQSVVVREAKQKVDLTKYIEEHLFNFDRAFDENTTNHLLYLEAVRPLVDALFSKAKCTCFAYGQTGSGKTFTMMGNTVGDNKENQNPIPGLYLLASQDIFALLDQEHFSHLVVFISFYEIYCGKLHDLLNERQEVFAREDHKKNVNIVGLSEKRVLNVHSLMQIIDFGNSVRTTGTTSANLDSSRSHAILQITLKEGNKIFGKMSFIDLAGSERGADVADTKKQTKMDGAEINKSLLALKECIRALDQDKKHTPFRGSKLTLVLKDSFTGNCKTVMIGNISPSSGSCEHTLNTLRYADRVKELKKPQDNTIPLSQADLLAQQLMLPRLQKNSTKITIREENDEDDQNTTNTTIGGVLNFNNTNASKSKIFANASLGNQNFGTTNSLSNVFSVQNQSTQMSLDNMTNNHSSLLSNGTNSHNINPKPETNGTLNNSFFPTEQQMFFNNHPNSNLLLPPKNSNNTGNHFTNQQAHTFVSNNQSYPPNDQNYVTNSNNLFGQTPQTFHQNQLQFKQPTQQIQKQKLPHNPNNIGSSLTNNTKMTLENPFGFNKNRSSKDLNASRDSNSMQNEIPKDSNWMRESPSSSIDNQSSFLSFPAPNNQSFININETPISTKKPNTSKTTREDIKSNGEDSLSSFKVKSEEDLSYLNQKHEEIINKILTEEEEVITSHRRNIDEIVEVTRQEMLILNEVEKPASDIDDYVANLENMINYKIDIMNTLKAKLLRLKGHLKEEESISKKFYEQSNGGMDIDDMNQGSNQ